MKRAKVFGYKLLDGDQSLTTQYKRVRYPVGEWVTVSGNGAYVSLSDGLLSGCGDVTKHVLARFECEGTTEVSAPEGVKCFRRVKRLAMDVEDYARIATYDFDKSVRVAAAEKVEDQAVLAWIVEHDVDWGVRKVVRIRLAQLQKESKS
jgi:hypothetical protein